MGGWEVGADGWGPSSHYYLHLIWQFYYDFNDCLPVMRISYCSCSYASANCESMCCSCNQLFKFRKVPMLSDELELNISTFVMSNVLSQRL